mmetsp:Transcript_4290/g.13724  ORF Transcript_4290/g.13724 Transcript_4290/m.13724 type:complete len:1009 (+) Transcript_4290:1477-4503(+)
MTDAIELKVVSDGLTREKAGDPDCLASLLDAPREEQKLTALGGLEGICSAMGTSSLNGLPQGEDIEARKVKYGPNSREPPKLTPLWVFAWEALQDPTLILLTGAGILSIIIGCLVEDPDTGWIEGTAIMLAVIIVVAVQSINDWSKEKKFMALLAKRNERVVPVVRGGTTMNIDSTELVVGDIVELGTGDQIPGDGVLVESSSLVVDESALTGESDEVKKSVEKNRFLISGTTITNGTGRMVVVAVGAKSQWGKTLALLESPDTQTDLQQKLEAMATFIGKAGLAVALLTITVLMIRWGVKEGTGKRDDDDDQKWYSFLLEAVITGITIAVVAIPEGLPLAVTISLMYSLQRMMKDNNFVRHLDKCEVMGNATAICSDKTGTLTTNRMAVMRGYVGGETFSLENGEAVPTYADEVKAMVTTGMCINSTAFLQEGPGGSVDYAGNKTECAMLIFARKMGIEYTDVRKTTQKVHTVPFSSARKRMSTAVRLSDGRIRLYCKGASERVLEDCETIVGTDGSVSPLSEAQKGDIEAAIYDFASSGLRTLCLACKDFTQAEWDAATGEGDDAVEKHLTCVMIAGIMDPVREEVPAAVAQCVKAGIKVRMVTGDNITTAINIAERCGIYQPNVGLAMEGPEFAALAEAAEAGGVAKKMFLDKVVQLQVLARSQPKDKHTLVGALQEIGEVVAVTGDGTNDAPALKLADVGFAMGIAGTEVAKEAADIILLDDNFRSLVLAVMWGRNVYDAIRKFVQFQLAVNVTAVVVAFLGALTVEVSPLTAVQLLWVNLIMDALGALALATEAPTMALLDRMPYRKDDAIISLEMWRFVLGSAVYQVVVLLVLLFKGKDLLDIDKNGWDIHHGDAPGQHFTVIFNVFVYLQLFNMINARRLEGERDVFSGMVSNHLFMGILVGCGVIQAVLVEFTGRFVNVKPLSAEQWVVSVAIGFGSLLWYQVLVFFPKDMMALLPFINKNAELESDATKTTLATMSRSLSSRRSSRGVPSPTKRDSLVI